MRASIRAMRAVVLCTIAIPVPLLLGGCQSDAREADPIAPPDGAAAAYTHGLTQWSDPVNLGPTVNSPFVDFTPEISKDELSLYFSSNRPGGLGSNDLWVSRRPRADAPWEQPVNLGSVVNSPANDGAPHLSRNGHLLYFTTNRPGGQGGNDVWVSWREDVHDDLAWNAPVNLGAGVNGPGFEAGATRWGPEFYFTSDQGANVPLDIYVSTIADGGSYGPAVLVTELSSVGNDLRPTIRFDGQEIFLSSDRAGTSGFQDLWVSLRNGDGSWSTPANLGAPVNTEYFEQQPALSKDGGELYFASDRPGGSGGADMYVATRLAPSW